MHENLLLFLCVAITLIQNKNNRTLNIFVNNSCEYFIKIK